MDPPEDDLVVVSVAAVCVETVFFEKSAPEASVNAWRVNRHVCWTRTLSDPEFRKYFRLPPPFVWVSPAEGGGGAVACSCVPTGTSADDVPGNVCPWGHMVPHCREVRDW